MNVERAAEVLKEARDVCLDPSASFNIEREHDPGEGRFVRLFVGTKEARMKLKIGTGTFRNFR